MYFKINDKLTIKAETYETRYSWGHKAHLYRVTPPTENDELICSDKITYHNRTWERYEFETILYSIVEKALKHRLITTDEGVKCHEYIKNYEEPNRFATMANIAKMGDLLTNSPKEANSWKMRMLKAGLPEGALIQPDDWDSLSEEEKTTRLDGVINILQSK